MHRLHMHTSLFMTQSMDDQWEKLTPTIIASNSFCKIIVLLYYNIKKIMYGIVMYVEFSLMRRIVSIRQYSWRHDSMWCWLCSLLLQKLTALSLNRYSSPTIMILINQGWCFRKLCVKIKCIKIINVLNTYIL